MINFYLLWFFQE